MFRTSLFDRFIFYLFVVLTVLIFSSATGFATNTGVSIRQDTTWSLAGSPYIIIQNVHVDEGVTLTIEPGVRVEFDTKTDQLNNQKFNITISGQLIARGTEKNPIVFTSSRENPEPGDWHSIEFTETAIGAVYNSDGIYQSGSIFEYATIEYGGGGTAAAAIYANGSAPYLNYVTIQKNNKHGVYYHVVDEKIFLDSCMFTENFANDSGGAIFYSFPDDFSHDDSSLTVRNCTFTENAAGGSGGAISASSFSFLTVCDSTFIGNSANGSGGAISASTPSTPFHYSSSLTINDSTFTENSANDSGGAVSYYHSSLIAVPHPLTVSDSTFIGNFAGDNGGAISHSAFGLCHWARLPLTVSDSTFTGNFAGNNGGAIYHYNSIITDSSLISGCAFFRNSAGDNGGAIYFIPVELSLSDTLISQNYGINALFFTNGTITRCSIINNYPPKDDDDASGDGIYVSGSSRSPIISDSNIFGHVRYDIVNASSSDIEVTGNYWRTEDDTSISLKIYDEVDDSEKGEVIYSPYLNTSAPEAPVPDVPTLPDTKDISIELSTSLAAGAVMNSGDTITLEWETTGILSSEIMAISMKRDAVNASVSTPDNVNWYRFTDKGAYRLNDGIETVTVPSGLTPADDWRFYVRHVSSDICNSSDGTFSYVPPVDKAIFSQEIYEYGDQLVVTLPPNPHGFSQYVAIWMPSQSLYFMSDLHTVAADFTPWGGEDTVLDLPLLNDPFGAVLDPGTYTVYLFRISNDIENPFSDMSMGRLGVSEFTIIK